MPINFARARQLLKDFDHLQTLFVEELNWDVPRRAPLEIQVKDDRFLVTAVAEKGGMVVFTVENKSGDGIPERPTRLAIDNKVTEHAHEHLLVFVNQVGTTSLWQWVGREDGRRKPYEHRYHVEQPGDSLLQKLEGIAFSWDDLDEEGRASITVATERAKAAFATEKVTKRFFDEFKGQHDRFLDFIQGVEQLDDRQWYASVMLNRLMFIYFIQKKGFLGGDGSYLGNRLSKCRQEGIPYYQGFLVPLFFEGFGTKPEERSSEANDLLGDIPYLNGGLFMPHQIETENPDIEIPDTAFECIFAFFDQYQWHLDDRPLRADNEINPDVLGYIFEKYINQKELGAYYTKEDITGYISKNTVLPFLFDKLQHFCYDAVVPLPIKDIESYIHDAVARGVDLELPEHIALGLDDVSKRDHWNESADPDYALPTETWREHIARRKQYQRIKDAYDATEIISINDFITYNLDIIKFTHDFLNDAQDPMVIRAFYFECLKQMTILDPTCGSGAFLFAALNLLEPLYEICLERMEEFLARKKRHPQWATDFEAELARLRQHPSRRYFIYKSIIVNNLFGVDILEEAVEIAKLRMFLKLMAEVEDVDDVEPLPDIDFNILAGNTLVGYANIEEIEKAKAGRLDFGEIVDKVRAVDRNIQTFRQLQTEHSFDARLFRESKANLQARLHNVQAELNKDLAAEYGAQDLDAFIASHKPLHWYVEFNDVIQHGGFDVIIGNPPFVSYAKVRDTYRVAESTYTTVPCGNLYAFVVERSIALLREGGRFGVILPLSSTNANSRSTFQELLRGIPACFVAHFAVRPGKLFNEVDVNIAIVCGGGEHPVTATTNLLRWPSAYRDALFSTLTYTPHSTRVKFAAFPKFGDPMERSIWDKLLGSGPPLSTFSSDEHQRVLAFHGFGRYWRKCILESLSDNYQEFSVAARVAPFALCLLNSQLAYWYWIAISDCYRFTKTDALNLPVPQGADEGRWEALSRRLMDSYERYAHLREKVARNKRMTTEKQFFPERSKAIIDEIDRVLAEHYGFTDEELDFIINYDIKYRMGGAKKGDSEN